MEWSRARVHDMNKDHGIGQESRGNENENAGV